MPFHEFNPITGRLKQSTNIQPLYPLRPKPLQSTEVDIMFDSMKTKPVRVQSQFSANLSTLSPKMKYLYEKYQFNLEQPTYTLGGRKDKFLLGYCVIALTGGIAAALAGIVGGSN